MTGVQTCALPISCLKVLGEIGADRKQKIIVLNKIDKLPNNDLLPAELNKKFPEARRVSVKTGEGLSELIEDISTVLFGEKQDFILKPEEYKKIEQIRKTGVLYKEEWQEDGIHITARIK